MAGSVVESRYNYNGGVGMPVSGVPASPNTIVPGTDKFKKYAIIAIVVAMVEFALIGVLLVISFSQEEKVCTYDDIIKELENDDSPSENWKIYDDVMFDIQEIPLKVYAEAISNGNLSEKSISDLTTWSNEYVGKFGGDALMEGVAVRNVKAFMSSNDDKSFWRLLLETSGGCARFDFSDDFMFLEEYSLTAGNCDEFVD